MRNKSGSPFLSDQDFEEFFGSDIARVARILGQYADAVCPQCGGKCCRFIRCRFYSPEFGCCPIHEYRPAKCRLYFCSEITSQNAEAALLLSRLIMDGYGLGIFLTFPAEIRGCDWLASSGIKEAVNNTMHALEKGDIDSETARGLLIGLVQQLRGYFSG